MAGNEQLSKQELREKAIKKEFNRLKRTFKNFDLDKKRLAAAEGLMQESAFMRVTLEELKKDITENGAVDEMSQGEYTIMRESPAAKTYNTMIQRYTTVNKELFNLLPKDKPKPEDDGFESFVNAK
ncbi:hypothetical protein [Salibacterium lacus]|uniref:P27 family phage terminase small subunit n=1 Tax=Salibacterium lacus TaxID=1898109 RepID=A0ABW5T274_9BACI